MIITIPQSRLPAKDWTPDYVNELIFNKGHLTDNRSGKDFIRGLIREYDYYMSYSEVYDVGVTGLLQHYLSSFKCRG